MKILHISTSDNSGGAAIAAMRLHEAMLEFGLDSTFLCLNKMKNEGKTLTVNRWIKIKSKTLDIIRQVLFEQLYLRYNICDFSNIKYGYKLGQIIDFNRYDIIYIHWINGNFLSIEGLKEICKKGKKVFWFMHDMFPITGGCHHSFECGRYVQNCGECPCLKHSGKYDFSYKQLKYKCKTLAKYKNFSFIAPSKWLYECARKSSVGKSHAVYHIPNLLDVNIFRQLDKKNCRDVLNLPYGKKLILFGADRAVSNLYKGFGYFVDAMEILKKEINLKDVEILIFGSYESEQIQAQLSYPCHFFGYLHDIYSLLLLYNAADVFCMPSCAESFGQTALESIFCGTPVVAFNTGGLPDIVSSKTGYLAKYKDSHDFAKGINLVLSSGKIDSSTVIKMFNGETVVNKHIKLWTS